MLCKAQDGFVSNKQEEWFGKKGTARPWMGWFAGPDLGLILLNNLGVSVVSTGSDFWPEPFRFHRFVLFKGVRNGFRFFISVFLFGPEWSRILDFPTFFVLGKRSLLRLGIRVLRRF
jgi:hypothetical protein